MQSPTLKIDEDSSESSECHNQEIASEVSELNVGENKTKNI